MTTPLDDITARARAGFERTGRIKRFADFMDDVASQPAYSMVTLHVPWVNLTIVFTVVYLVALATSLAPAIRASRIYPAEALRYE